MMASLLLVPKDSMSFPLKAHPSLSPTSFTHLSEASLSLFETFTSKALVLVMLPFVLMLEITSPCSSFPLFFTESSVFAYVKTVLLCEASPLSARVSSVFASFVATLLCGTSLVASEATSSPGDLASKIQGHVLLRSPVSIIQAISQVDLMTFFKMEA